MKVLVFVAFFIFSFNLCIIIEKKEQLHVDNNAKYQQKDNTFYNTVRKPENNESMTFLQTNETLHMNNKEQWYIPNFNDKSNEKDYFISDITKNNLIHFINNIRKKTITNPFMGYSKLLHIKCKNCDAEFERLSKDYFNSFDQNNFDDVDFKMIGISLYCFQTTDKGISKCLFTEIGKIPYVKLDTEQAVLYMLEILSNENIKGNIYIYTPVSSCCYCLNTVNDFLEKYPELSIHLYFVNDYTGKHQDCVKGDITKWRGLSMKKINKL